MAINARLVTHILALIGLITFADICLFSALLVKPFSEHLSWCIACWTAGWFWGYMQLHWEFTRNALPNITISGDRIPKKESAVVISNHQSYADWYLIQHLAQPSQMLGNCRYFVKKEIVWQIPLFGWAFWAIGMILVSRNWTSDSKLIEEAFGTIKANEHDVWVVLYPEGTRRTEKKLLQSQAFVTRQGKEPLQHLLWPRTKGLVATIQGLRDSHVKYIYDLTLIYTAPGKPGRIATLGEQLSVKDLSAEGYRYHIDVRRVAIKDLPKDEEKLKMWCEDAWRRKDRVMAKVLEGK